jgi:hypothetical protein
MGVAATDAVATLAGSRRVTVTAVLVLAPAEAVTDAVRVVVRVVRACPLASVIAVGLLSCPSDEANVTRIPDKLRPAADTTVASKSTVPPAAGTEPGFAARRTVSTAAAPTVIRTLLLPVVVVPPFPLPLPVPVPVPDPMPPDVAVTSARPDESPATNVETAYPFLVCASGGSIRPRFVVKRTVVPFWTAVPLSSTTKAVTSVVPPVGTKLLAAVIVRADPVGAVSGTVSQAAATRASTTPHPRLKRVTIVIPIQSKACRRIPFDRNRS